MSKQIPMKTLCAKDGCKYKPSELNKYCMLHQIQLLVDSTRELNKKLCVNYIRGCKRQLDLEYKFTRCDECLVKDRAKDKERRDQAKLSQETNEDLDKKMCSVCCQEFPIESFSGIKGDNLKTCKACREGNKLQDTRRDRDHRNALARVNDQKEERKEVKKQWNEDNYEKVVMKTLNYRQRRIESDQEGFMKQNADNARNWRTNNPEKVAENNEYKKNDKTLQYNVYMRNANEKNLEFSISESEFVLIVVEPCNYCGIIQTKGFNGIDRREQIHGYRIENCVSCCQMCNYMKGTLSDVVFVKRVEHILTYNKMTDGNLYPECFREHHGTSYEGYKNRALEKELNFVLTKEMFILITEHECYICGKQNSDTHRNGIDRFDNTHGYTPDNCRSCCGECNYIKKGYDHDKLFEKISVIYQHYRGEKLHRQPPCIVKNVVDNAPDDGLSQPQHDLPIALEPPKLTPCLESVITNDMMIRGNKKTKEEKNEQTKLRNQRCRELQRIKCGDENYKKEKAAYIAKYRREKKDNECK